MDTKGFILAPARHSNVSTFGGASPCSFYLIIYDSQQFAYTIHRLTGFEIVTIFIVLIKVSDIIK
jgi:hypothetical protein